MASSLPDNLREHIETLSAHHGLNSPALFPRWLINHYGSTLVPGDIFYHSATIKGDPDYEKGIWILVLPPVESRLSFRFSDVSADGLKGLIDQHVLRGLKKTSFYDSALKSWEELSRMQGVIKDLEWLMENRNLATPYACP